MNAGFTSILDLMKAFPDEQTCINRLERIRWNGKVVSPFDPESTVYKCQKNRYKCRNTNKYFNVRTGTVFEDTKMPLQKWFIALYIFSSHKKGISSHQLARDLDVTQKTAWFVLHRLRYIFDHPQFKKAFSGIVEVDETYIGGNEKNKHESKRITGNFGGRGKAPVVGIVQRGGSIVVKAFKDIHFLNVTSLISDTVKQNSVVCTDESKLYNTLKRNYEHLTVNHRAKEFVNGMAHTNTIDGFWSQMKRGIDGVYHSISVKHLQSYIDEYALRHNTRKNVSTAMRFDLILDNMTRRLKYQDLIRKDDEEKRTA